MGSQTCLGTVGGKLRTPKECGSGDLHLYDRHRTVQGGSLDTSILTTITNNQLFDVNEPRSVYEYVNFKTIICQKKRICGPTWPVCLWNPYRHNGAKQSELDLDRTGYAGDIEALIHTDGRVSKRALRTSLACA